jgi:hypothetical protein
VGLQQGPLYLMITIEEFLGKKISGSGLETREYSRRDPSRQPRGALYVDTNFVDKRWSLDRYSSLADSGQGVFYRWYTQSCVSKLTCRQRNLNHK